MKNPIRKLLMVTAVVCVALSAALPAWASSDESGFQPVTLCHHTGSESNPYVVITVDDQGALNGHLAHHDDIIPITDLNGDGEITKEDCGWTPTTTTTEATTTTLPPVTTTVPPTTVPATTTTTVHIAAPVSPSVPPAAPTSAPELPFTGIVDTLGKVVFGALTIVLGLMFMKEGYRRRRLGYGKWGRVGR